MRVAVQEELDTCGCALRRDVDEMEFQVFPDERELQRPRMGVIVSADNVKRNSELLEFDESLRIADVAQMPDLVRRLKHGGQAGGITVMGIGNHCDAHDRFQSDAGPRVTQNRRDYAEAKPLSLHLSAVRHGDATVACVAESEKAYKFQNTP